MFYLVIKTIHIISVICWMAGLLYLPRLFIYHVENINNPEINNLFKKMERKLFNIIVTPSMISSLITGGILMYILGIEGLENWFYFKAIGIIGLLICHWLCFCYLKNFFEGKNMKTSKYFRFFNEIPSLMMILIIIFVVIKPV